MTRNLHGHIIFIITCPFVVIGFQKDILVFLAYNIFFFSLYSLNFSDLDTTLDTTKVFVNGAHPLNISSGNVDSPWFLSQINRQQLAPPLPPSSRSCLRTGFVISHPLAVFCPALAPFFSNSQFPPVGLAVASQAAA